MIDKYGSKILIGIVILFVLRLCFLFFGKNPYTVLDREYGMNSGYVESNVIKVEEIDDKQTMYFTKFGDNEIRQALVMEYPFGYRVESGFWFNNRAGASEWFVNEGNHYGYSRIDYRMWDRTTKAKTQSWIVNGVLYDDNIKRVAVDGEECTIIDLQLEDEKLRYFYYIYPDRLSLNEISANFFDEMNTEFIY